LPLQLGSNGNQAFGMSKVAPCEAEDLGHPHPGCERDQNDHAQPEKRLVYLSGSRPIHFLIERVLERRDLLSR
jgi:hypothetical protein